MINIGKYLYSNYIPFSGLLLGGDDEDTSISGGASGDTGTVVDDAGGVIFDTGDTTSDTGKVVDDAGRVVIDTGDTTIPDQGILTLPDAPTTDPQTTIDKAAAAYGEVDPGTVPTYADVDVTGIDTTFKPGEEYVSSSATVAGQLESLLSRDSKYITQARQSAAERAQERGLLSTSLAAGAGEAAAIEAGLPIAQQDAETYARALQQQQTSEYEFISDVAKTELSGRLTIQEANTQMQNQIVQNTFDTSIAQASDEGKVWFQDAQNTFNADMAGFETQLQGIINEQAFDAATKESLLNNSATVMQNYQISIEKTLLDPAIQLMLKEPGGPAAVNALLATQQTLAANTIKFMGNSVGIDMTTWVDSYLASTTISEEVSYG